SPLPACRVDIHPSYTRPRESLAKQTLDLLRAEAALLEIPPAATGAIAPRISLWQPVVADQPLRIPVVRQGNAAMRARCHRAAVNALDERRVAASIEQQDALLTALHRLHNR